MKARRERRSNSIATISGGNDGEVPPVPIPNTEVKLSSAESTWLDTAREDKSLPDSIILSSSMVEHSAVNRVVVGSSPTRGVFLNIRLRGQAVKTSPFHGGNTSSNLVGVIVSRI